MRKEYYYVYSKGLLGVKTNVEKFKWIYGSIPNTSIVTEYEKCLVKFNVYVVSESKLESIKIESKKFNMFSWNEENKTLYYRRKLFNKIQIGYNLRILKNEAKCYIGKNYYKFIKQRLNNLQGVYYLLSDIANIILLRNGYLTLYASAVNYTPYNKGYVFFSPPNTGKTLTATKLCENYDCRLIGEDIVITDGTKLFACPFTNSYRKKLSNKYAGSSHKVPKREKQNTCQECSLSSFIILSLGEVKQTFNNEQILSKIEILNGYLFNYFSSPIIKILGYFDNDYQINWNDISHDLLFNALKKIKSIEIFSKEPINFYRLIKNEFLGEKK